MKFRLLFLCSLFCIGALQAQVKKTPAKPVTKTAAKPKAKVAPAKKTAKPAAKDSVIVVEETQPTVKITTDLGDIVVMLYNKTPKHRDNFIKLVKEHFYDSLLFHRIIPEFMIQGGDPQSKNATPGSFLGMGGVGYTIPAEMDTTLYHKKGALAAARDNNPERASSGCQFYIVQGKTYTDASLDMLEQRSGIKFSSAKRMTYKMVGGTPQLDMNYTVFGEVISGLDVVDKIATAPKDGNNRPINDIHMKMELVQ